MNVLASTSTACYTCVLARAVAVNPARFSTSIKSHREGGIWKGKKRPDPSLEQTRSLIEELRRLNKEDGVQVDNSVFATGPRDRRYVLAFTVMVCLRAEISVPLTSTLIFY